MKRSMLLAVLAIVAVFFVLDNASLSQDTAIPQVQSAAQSDCQGYIVWEALNIFGQLFVDPESILTTDKCAYQYPCGGLPPTCVLVRKAKVLGPYCSEDEAWAQLCSRVSDPGTYAIWSNCPWWVHVGGVRHTVSWNPWNTCGKYGGFGGDTVIPTPRPDCCIKTPPPPTPTTIPTPTPTEEPAEWDVYIEAAEYVQVTQCLDPSEGDTTCPDNSIPLVRGKLTAVRVYPMIKVLSGRKPEPGETLAATLYLDSPSGGSLQPTGVPLDLVWLSRYCSKEIGLRREGDPFFGAETCVLNFHLPPEWSQHDSIRVRIELTLNADPGQPVEEKEPANNRRDLTLTFEEYPDLHVLAVPVRYEPPGQPPSDPNLTYMALSLGGIQLLYPLREGGLDLRFVTTATFRSALQGEDDSPLLAWLNRLYAVRAKMSTRNVPDQVFAWLGEVPNAFYGAADPIWFDPPGQGRVAWAQSLLFCEDSFLLVARHEMAHNFGAFHVDRDDACGAEKSGATDWPYANAQIQETGYSPLVGGVNAASSEDIMTYCCPALDLWVSPWTYRKLLASRFQPSTGELAQSLNAQEYLMVTGIVYKGGGGSLQSLERIHSTQVSPAPTPGQDYCLQLQDGGGQVLHSACFDVSFLSHHGTPLDQRTFFFVLPFPGGTQAVVLARDTTVLDTRAASAHAPAITITSPAPGANWSGTQTIRWTASDADGDALTYNVVYSYDSGATWQPLELDLRETSYALDTGGIPGGNQARLQVWAMDGFHTSRAEVGPFSIPGKDPRMLILYPQDGTRFLSGRQIVLSGQGDDPEDGALPDAALSWYSDLDGQLGTGPVLQMANPSAGEHHITLTGQDDQGNVGTTTITIQVGGQQCYLPVIFRRFDLAHAPPTPTPTLAPCDPIFLDNFDDGTLTGWTANRGTWSVVAGALHGVPGGVIDSWNIKQVTGSASSYEGTVTICDGAVAGLSFRTTDGTKGYDLLLDVYAGALRLLKRPSNAVLGIYSFDVQRNRPYRLRVEARSGTFDVYLDGTKRFRAHDYSYTGGKYGVFAYNSQADFDDLRACRLDVPYDLRVNMGGKVYTDTLGLLWAEAQAYIQGSWGYSGTVFGSSTTDPITGTEDDTLYQTLLWGGGDYRFDVPNGQYRVELRFAELYFTGAGRRVFDVQLEGQTVLTNLDIFAVAGHDTAYNRTFEVTVTDGQLNLSFVSKTNFAVINAIQIVAIAGPAPSPTQTVAVTPTRTATASATTQVTGTITRTATRTHTPVFTSTRTPTRTATCTLTTVPPLTNTRTPTATVTRTGTRTATPTATTQPTPGEVTVQLYDGDARSFVDQPDIIAYANTQYVGPPAGVTITDSGGLWRQNEWVALMSAGQWIQARYSGHTTAVGVQLWGDSNDGWARVLVDGVERWRGSIYGTGSGFIKYLQISGLPSEAHTIRVECLGINGAGGGDDVAMYFFGFGPAAPAGIHGRITCNGVAAGSIALRLQVYDDATESTVATTTTDADGRYLFTAIASLGTGQTYYVLFAPDVVDTRYIYVWFGPDITSYISGTSVPGGDLDIANVSLASPAYGSALPLPITFVWQRRNLPTDTYRWYLYDLEPDGGYWYSSNLGYADRYTLSSWPQGAQYGREYGWYLRVYGEPTSFGESYAWAITLTGGGAMPPGDAGVSLGGNARYSVPPLGGQRAELHMRKPTRGSP